MTSAGGRASAFGDESSYGRFEAREPGARRRKLAGYLRAANELRQTYQQSYMQSWGDGHGSEERNAMPGSFPSTRSGTTVTSGEEQMILFPSYARRHIKQKPSAVPGTIQETSDTGSDVRDTAGAGDTEYWKAKWQQFEDDNAIVDVDVRGWVFTPQKGPMNRKSRLFVGLARQMVGIPAPATSPTYSASSSRSTSPHPIREKLASHNAKVEEDLVAKEAESLMKKGEAEANAAHEGAYSEGRDGRSGNIYARAQADSTSLSEDSNFDPVGRSTSWNTPADMNQEELAKANSRLMTRVKPFLANPSGYVPISAFFYNDSVSRQKTIDTDASGHFNLRAALDFIPTHVRILATEGLSATEEVQITSSIGVSVISDVDDTIKHSAIVSGAREIFRNVFIRDLGELTIRGVQEWYGKLADLGVAFHYVSNSPWQLYPLLKSFCSLAGLPKGSFHLKQYSGMFQGIFEPVAERKKGTLDRILRDFPERRFILVGDSGEADLEVYTDVVEENPGRILAVYIRDVTTPQKTQFFDSAPVPSTNNNAPTPQGSLRVPSTNEKSRHNTSDDSGDDDAALKAGIAASLEDLRKISANNNTTTSHSDIDSTEKRPALPPRRRTQPPPPVDEDLIDLASDDDKPDLSSQSSAMGGYDQPKRPPERPSKPRQLSTNSVTKNNQHILPRKPAPPVPKKPSTAVQTGGLSKTNSSPLSSTNDSTNGRPQATKPKPLPPPKPPSQRSSDRETALNTPLKPSSSNHTVDSESSNAQSRRSPLAGLRQEEAPFQPPPPPQRSNTTSTQSSHEPSTRSASSATAAPALPARKPLSSYPAAAAQYAANMYNAATASASSASVPQRATATSSSTRSAASSAPSIVHANSFPLDWPGQGQAQRGAAAQANRKEELWKRRWADAQRRLKPYGVVLRSWRVGGDVGAESVQMVERELRQLVEPKGSAGG